METGYKKAFFIAPDADFEELAHCGTHTDITLVPLSRKEEFLKSSGLLCMFPMTKEIQFYDDENRYLPKD